MTGDPPDIAVIGAGIAGACVAFDLQRRGMQVLLLDRTGDTNATTTWASGGMLAPLAEMLTGGLLDIGVQAKAYYPEFLAHLNHDLSTEPPVRFEQGIYVPVAPSAQRQSAMSYFKKARHSNYLHIKSKLELEAIGIANVDEAVYLEDEGAVDPRHLLHALLEAFAQRGGQRRIAHVHRLSTDKAQSRVHTNVGEILVQGVVICAGHQAGDIFGIDWPGFGPLSSDRGILLRVTGVPAPPGVLFDHRLDGVCYVIPDAQGVRIGATSHPGDRRTTPDNTEIEDLWNRADRIWPLTGGSLVDVSVGFRPVGPGVTGEPFVDELAPNIWGLLGLHRHGILYAPILARYLADQIIERKLA